MYPVAKNSNEWKRRQEDFLAALQASTAVRHSPELAAKLREAFPAKLPNTHKGPLVSRRTR